MRELMQKTKFYAEIAEGKLKLDRYALFETYLKSLPEGQRVEITIAKESEDNTHDQFEYYFSCVVQPLADHLGYSKIEMDGVICKQLLTENAGTKKEFVQSKALLNRAELAAFIDKAIMLAVENGVIVAPPNKYWKLTK